MNKLSGDALKDQSTFSGITWPEGQSALTVMRELYINRDGHFFFSLGMSLNQSTHTFACSACISQVSWVAHSALRVSCASNSSWEKGFDSLRMQWPCCFNWGNLHRGEKTVGVRGSVNRLFFTHSFAHAPSMVFHLLVIFSLLLPGAFERQMKRAERQ